MRITHLGILPAFGFTVMSAAASDYLPYVSMQSVTYSQPVSINSMLDDWGPPFKGGNKAITYNKMEMGVAGQNWQLGVLSRYDYLMTFSDQTAELYYLTKNHLSLESGKTYELNLKARQQFSRGLRFAFQQQMTSTFNAGLAVSYLEGITLTDGSIHGSALVTAENDYDFSFDVDYVYSHDALFSRDVQAPQGVGYSLDVKFDWQINERIVSHVSIIDLLGKIFWDNAPYTIATASSATKTYDADGYVRYQPLASGLESNRNFTQRLPRKIFAAAHYQWKHDTELLVEIQDFAIVRFTSIGAGWKLSERVHFEGLLNFTTDALTLRYQQQRLRFEIGSDNYWNIHHGRYFNLLFSYNTSF